MKKKTKQILAILTILLLLSLALGTLIIALLDFPGKEHLLTACLLASIGLPVLLWLLLRGISQFPQKEDGASPENSWQPPKEDSHRR